MEQELKQESTQYSTNLNQIDFGNCNLIQVRQIKPASILGAI